MKKKSSFISLIFIATSMLALVSCGSDGESSSKSSSKREPQLQEEDDQGIYRAVLKPLNTTVAGNTTGTVKIKIEGDDVIVESNVSGAPVGIKHYQNIMTAKACPTESSDTNKDSLIDVTEAFSISGQILIPLDSDLSTQLDGMSYGPIANSTGSYKYKRSTSLSQLLSDLGAPDPDLTDSVVKLPLGDNLNLPNRVIIIHGVRGPSTLPSTVRGLGDISPESLMPIACGQIVRVKGDEPAESETPVETETI